MVYLVSGYMRTGTSMMMKALEAGGMEAVYNPIRENLNKFHGDEYYQPNGGGFYELQRHEYRHRDFPLMYEGKLIKMLFKGLTRLRVLPTGYRVVFMQRDPEEILQSYDAFFQVQGGIPEQVHAVINDYYPMMNDNLARLRNRKDTEVVTLWYRAVVENPIGAFEYLWDSGWPIDPQKAAAIVDPTLYRFRKEQLAIGAV